MGPKSSERPAVVIDDDSYVLLDPLLDQMGIVGDMAAVLGILDTNTDRIADFLEDAQVRPLSGTRIGAPVPRPRHLFAVGANTHSHVAEASALTSGVAARTPLMILMASSSVCGPHDDIVMPAETQRLDYEVELALVIGNYAHRVRAEDAMRHVAGYMASSDVTARDVQTGADEDSDFYWQHARSKSFPTFNPTGPWILTRDEIDDPAAITLQTYVNGDLRQNSDLTDLVASIPRIIESFSSAVPLYPGDVILTGSPAGVGALMDPPSYLGPDDVLHTVVGQVGELKNTIRTS